jgi:hypothetical protein
MEATMRKPNPERDAFLRDVLRYFAGKSAAGLQEMMRSGSPELACGAAHLLLDGHKFGAWRARPHDLALARKLVEQTNPVVKIEREAEPMAKEMQPLKWSDLGPADSTADSTAAARKLSRPGSPDFMASIRRVLDIHHRARATLDDPTTTPHMKIAAIQEWIAVLDANGMGDIVPADIRQGLAVIATRCRKEQVS